MTTVLFVTEGTGNWTKIKMAVKEESLRYSLDHFVEVREITTLIESIGSICHDDILLEAAEERFIGKLAYSLVYQSKLLQSHPCYNIII